MPWLTIAIPTYNRAQPLSDLLASIRAELPSVAPNDIEVLVINNASSDGTHDMVEALRVHWPTLRYLRNDSNLGMQGNFVKCLHESRGRYTWMIGDDEIVEPGGLRRVVAALARHPDKALYVFNYSSEPSPPGTPFLRHANRQPLTTCEDQLLHFTLEKGWLWTLGNLGMVVVETRRITAVDPQPHMASAFVQAGWYLEALHAADMAYIHETVFRTHVSSQTVNKERWHADGTAASFHHIVQSLDRFASLGITEQRVPLMFLNACSNDRSPVWNMFLSNVIRQIARGNILVDDREWETMLNLIDRVAENDLREAMTNYLQMIRRSIVCAKHSFENALWLVNRFQPNLLFGMA